MITLLLTFFSSFITTALIIYFERYHAFISLDTDLSGPQKFHINIVPRIGGASILIGLSLGILSIPQNVAFSNSNLIILLCCIPAFFIGLLEDLTKKITVRIRFFFIIFSATLSVLLLQVQISRIDISYLDSLFSIPLVGGIFAIFAISGLANSYNIIDGFHGLSSMVGFITLMGLAYAAHLQSNQQLVLLSLIMASSILGFFLWNYPRGLIFLGDGGAYLIGIWIGLISILLILSHQEISPWFALLINAYPVSETIFTIYRRKIHQKVNSTAPDALHLHTLIYRRIFIHHKSDKSCFSPNAKTAPFLWLFCSISILPALVWRESTPILMAGCLIYIGLYIWVYSAIVNFRTPSFLTRL